MTIDKFGRSSKSFQRDVKGPKGDGFNITVDGHYDMKEKRLTNLGEAVESQDAVTKTYVDSKLIPLDNDVFNLGNKRMRNLDDAIQDRDAVNLQTLKRVCLTHEDSGFDAGEKQINNLSNPTKPRDAATKKFVEKTCKIEHETITVDLAKQQEDVNALKQRITKCEGLIGSNKEYHDKNLNKFGVLLFKYIHKFQTGRSAVLPTVSEGDYINWEVLFADKLEGKETEEVEINPLPPNTYDLFMTEEGLSGASFEET